VLVNEVADLRRQLAEHVRTIANQPKAEPKVEFVERVVEKVVEKRVEVPVPVLDGDALLKVQPLREVTGGLSKDLPALMGLLSALMRDYAPVVAVEAPAVEAPAVEAPAVEAPAKCPGTRSKGETGSGSDPQAVRAQTENGKARPVADRQPARWRMADSCLSVAPPQAASLESCDRRTGRSESERLDRGEPEAVDGGDGTFPIIWHWWQHFRMISNSSRFVFTNLVDL
jgi:hypothetical protein